MAWCPKCRSEYIEGIAVCKDCDEILVESLEDYDAQKHSEQDEIVDAFISDDDIDSTNEDAEYNTNENTLLSQASQVYVKKEDKYKDVLSSAYTLLLVGFGGLVLLLLVITDIINLHLASPGKYITYGGIGTLLVIFIIIGLFSLRTSKTLAKEAVAENELTADILEWFYKTITTDVIDQGITKELGEEMKYFKRIENIKEIITKAYGELNDSYLDKLSEDIYQEIFL
jgi:murein DD-endopeptidase MepM/ murein hydrolase activator NlpD